MSAHRRPLIRFSDAPRGTCRWCGEPILYGPGPKQGQLDRRRRWHPECVLAWDRSDPREQRRIVRKRDRGVCRTCGVDTLALKREVRGRGRTRRLRGLGFHPRRSLWELDHIVPLIDGGGHEPSNLQTLCVPCHRAKSAEETKLRARSRAPAAQARLEIRAAKPQAETGRAERSEAARKRAARSEAARKRAERSEAARKRAERSEEEGKRAEGEAALLESLLARADAANARVEALLSRPAD